MSKPRRKKIGAYRRAKIKSGGYTASALAAVKLMQPLAHWKGRAEGIPFNQADSDVLAYIMGLAPVRQWVFGVMRASRAIVFDSATGTWRGANYPGGAA